MKAIHNSEEFGMIKPTLTTPDFIIVVPSEAIDGNTERPSSYLFVKAFIGKDGKKQYFFKSVTVQRDGMEVNVSNYIDRPSRLRKSLQEGKLLWKQTEPVSDSSDINQGLYKQPGNQSEPAVQGRVHPQSDLSNDKDNTKSDTENKNGEKKLPRDKDGNIDHTQLNAEVFFKTSKIQNESNSQL